jgi:hypothetical protein
MEIELKHILPYYEHNLHVRINSGVAVVNGISNDLMISIKDPDAVDAGMYVMIKEVRPLLLPLKFLVLNNPETGKPFFIDVLKAACELPFMGKNNKFWKTHLTGKKHLAEPNQAQYLEIDNQFNEYSFSIDLSNGDLSIYRNEELATTDNQAQYFRALHKYKFDTEGLIEANLAAVTNKL